MKLSKPLVVLDLETTGVWVEKDKIVEVAMIKTQPDNSKEKYHVVVNPGMSIPPAVSQLIGIRDQDVQDKPYFRQVAADVLEFIGDADLAGFNVERFDLPLLEREMFEAGHEFKWQNHTIYDAQKFYHLKEKRDLTAALKFYCDKDLENAHSAMADTEATLEILKAQVSRYGNDETGIESMQEFNYKSLTDFYDQGRKFRWWNGELYPMFGKYAKRYSLREMVTKDSKYLEWILRSDFSSEIKTLIEDALKGQYPVYEAESSESLKDQ